MARSTSYLAPWAPGYNKQELREQLNQRYKRSTKKMLKEAGMDYSMSRGYYYTEDDDWGPKPKQPPEKTIRLATGRKVKVYDNDLGGGVEYNNAINANNDMELSDYISTANFKYAIDGCGHIAKLEYAPYRTMMRVTFQPETYNGHTWGRDDMAVYFRVPTTVFGELYWLAESKQTSGIGAYGSPRHTLGVRFWDLVRIRGKRQAGRFPYTIENIREYTKKGRPVSGYKLQEAAKQQEADINQAAAFGEESVESLNATAAAFKKAKQRIDQEKTNATDKDEALATMFGNAKNAEQSLNNYGTMFKDKRLRESYTSLSTITDKYNFLVKHGIIDDYLEEDL